MRVARSSFGRLGTTTAAVVFEDVPADHPWRPAIEWVKAQGISNGCETGKFCPDRGATRGEVAVFLYRALAQQQQNQIAPAPDDAGVSTGISIFGKTVPPMAAAGVVLLIVALVARR